MSDYEYSDLSNGKVEIRGGAYGVVIESVGMDSAVFIEAADVPTVALELLKVAGQESVIVPKAHVGTVIETHSGDLMIDGQTYPARLSYWEASEEAKARGLADALSYAAKVDAALAFLRAKIAREDAEKAEAEAAEKKLQERRDALAMALGYTHSWDRAKFMFQKAVDQIIELEDKLAAK